MTALDSIRYEPKPLGEPAQPEVAALVDAGRAQRLVLYLGAGVSMSWPARGPTGNDVANRLRPIVSELTTMPEVELQGDDLEALAARVSRESLDGLKARAAEAWAFCEMVPNYGHETLALLLRERLIEVVSANWDCGVEEGGRQLGIGIDGVSRQTDLSDLPRNALPLYKVHGCARRPLTLVLTQDEVDTPRTWARAKVQNALTAGTVVFVGLGTVGAYVSEPVRELAEVWTDGAATVHVVDPADLSQDWVDALGDDAESMAIRMGADDFLDELLRATVSRALSMIGETVRGLDQHEQAAWSKALVDGHGTLVAALDEPSADAVLRWWRDGTVTLDRSFIFGSAGQDSLMCIAQLAALDGSPITVQGNDGALTVRSRERYFEVACEPRAHLDDVARRATMRVHHRDRAGLYSPGAQVTVAVSDALGTFPAASAPPDIAAPEPADSDIAASLVPVFVRAEDVRDGRLAA